MLVDLLAIAVFGVSGALTAVAARLDVVGVVVLGVVTGLGGGLIRDVLIGDTPPPTLTDWHYLAVAIGVGLATFVWHPQIGRLGRPINVMDAFGLGLFSVAGALKAADYGVSPVGAVVLGVVTGVGGSILRDLLVGQVPLLLRKSELYAIPATVGAALAVAGDHRGLPSPLVVTVSAGVIIAFRLVAIWRGWTAPESGEPLVRRARRADK
ncbi:trimeric intracellular cation channel family protein [Nocardioides montaniterrae]